MLSTSSSHAFACFCSEKSVESRYYISLWKHRTESYCYKQYSSCLTFRLANATATNIEKITLELEIIWLDVQIANWSRYTKSRNRQE